MDKSISKRCAKLIELGMHFNGDSYVGSDGNEDFNVHHTELQFDTDEEFDVKITKLTEEKKKRENTPLSLYVWEGVLSDHTDGVMFALATSVEEARKLIIAKSEMEYSDLMIEPRKVTEKEGFAIYGGG